MDVALNIIGETDPSGFPMQFLLAVLVMTPILVMSTRRRMRQSESKSGQSKTTGRRRYRSRSSRDVQERAESLRTKHTTETESGAAMLEFQKYTRTIQAQIDNRYQKLESATAHADQKIAELRQLLAQSGLSTDDAPGVDPNLDVWHSIATPRTQG
ncbi:MAG: hypothetical protein DHS20C16_27130 [Phycisphaerae bacterium]|nr:MAG: hypothetical protein DHS20C16_27130 [Phycisphaerae bacterium]